MKRRLLALLAYLKARVAEKSTWTAIGVGVAGGAALPAPFNWLFIAVGIAGAIVPTPSSPSS